MINVACVWYSPPTTTILYLDGSADIVETLFMILKKLLKLHTGLRQPYDFV